MSKTQRNDKSVQQGSCCGKLTFSELCEMAMSGELVMDVPGVLVLVNEESTIGLMEEEGLPENHKFRIVFPMLLGGLSRLAKCAVEYMPEALGVVAEWWGREGQASSEALLRRFLGEGSEAQKGGEA